MALLSDIMETCLAHQLLSLSPCATCSHLAVHASRPCIGPEGATTSNMFASTPPCHTGPRVLPFGHPPCAHAPPENPLMMPRGGGGSATHTWPLYLLNSVKRAVWALVGPPHEDTQRPLPAREGSSIYFTMKQHVVNITFKW